MQHNVSVMKLINNNVNKIYNNVHFDLNLQNCVVPVTHAPTIRRVTQRWTKRRLREIKMEASWSTLRTEVIEI